MESREIKSRLDARARPLTRQETLRIDELTRTAQDPDGRERVEPAEPGEISATQVSGHRALLRSTASQLIIMDSSVIKVERITCLR
jgi:hypothetical protein